MSVPPEPTAALDGTEPARTGAAPDGGTTVTRGDEPGVRPPVPPVADPPVPGSPPAGAPPAPPTAAGPVILAVAGRRSAGILSPGGQGQRAERGQQGEFHFCFHVCLLHFICLADVKF